MVYKTRRVRHVYVLVFPKAYKPETGREAVRKHKKASMNIMSTYITMIWANAACIEGCGVEVGCKAAYRRIATKKPLPYKIMDE